MHRTLEDAVADVLSGAGEVDPGLAPELRRAIAKAWIEHAASERAEATSLAHVATIVLELDGPPGLDWIATRACSDELRHAAICHRVARAYDPDIGDLPNARRFPRFVSTLPAPLAQRLLVLAQCCVQETLAAAYLERAHAAASATLPRAALRALLADEIDHGRIGYAFAASLDGPTRRALRSPLAERIEECRALWHARARALPEHTAPEHGVLAADTILRTIDDAIESLVLPGLRAVELA